MDRSEQGQSRRRLNYVDKLWVRAIGLAWLAALASVTGWERDALAGSPSDLPELAAEKHQADQERFIQLLREHDEVGADGDENWLAAIHVDDVFWSLRRGLALWAKRTHDGHSASAARMLGVDRTTLERWLRLTFPWDALPAVEVLKRSVVLNIHLEGQPIARLTGGVSTA